jgi:hypothetical protein
MYESLEVIFSMKTTSNYSKGLNFEIPFRKSKKVMKLPPRWVISSPRQFRIKWGLDVEKGLENPYQHLGSNFNEVPTRKKNSGYT